MLCVYPLSEHLRLRMIGPRTETQYFFAHLMHDLTPALPALMLRPKLEPEHMTVACQVYADRLADILLCVQSPWGAR